MRSAGDDGQWDSNDLPAGGGWHWDALLPSMVLVATVVVVLKSMDRINHDCAMYLQAAQLLLAGQRPYVDFVDINPPFIVYLNVVPATLAGWLSASIVPTFSFCVVVLAAWSTLSIQRSLARTPQLRDASTPLAAVWALYTLVMRASNDFGQREHLLVLLYAPYLIARSLRVQRQPEVGRLTPSAIFPALAAGCAVSIKPHYAVVAVTLEIYWFLWAPRLRSLFNPTILAFAFVPVLYVLHFALLPVEVRDAFLHRWLPLVAARYSVYDLPAAFLWQRSVILAAFIGMGAVALSPWRRSPAGVLAGALGVFLCGAVAAYFQQHKAWPYHCVPVVAATTLLLVLLAQRLVASAFVRGRKRRMPLPGSPPRVVHGDQTRFSASTRALLFTLVRIGAPILIGILWIFETVRLPLPLVDYPILESPLSRILTQYTEPGEAVLFVSTSVVPAYPLLLQTQRRPGSRYLWFFSIPMLATEGRQSGSTGSDRPVSAPPTIDNQAWLEVEEQRFLRDLIEDIESRRPPLIFVPTVGGCQGCPPGFSLMGYLERRAVLSRIAEGRTRLPDVDGLAAFVANDRLARVPPDF